MAVKFRVLFRGDDLGVFDSNAVTMDEAQQLEDKTGLTMNEMLDGVGKTSAKATRALIWFQRLRAGNPGELYENFTFGDYDIERIDEPDPTRAADGGRGNGNRSTNGDSAT